MENCKLIEFKEIGNNKIGYLIPLEDTKNVPFTIKRVYYIYSVPNKVVRGYHAHKKLEQVLICINGNVKLRLFNGIKQEVVELNNSSIGLYIGPYIWREMYDFSEGSVLLVLASEYYDENDYIRNYDFYLEEVKKRY